MIRSEKKMKPRGYKIVGAESIKRVMSISINSFSRATLPTSTKKELNRLKLQIGPSLNSLGGIIKRPLELRKISTKLIQAVKNATTI